jgi:hypothetical protein
VHAVSVFHKKETLCFKTSERFFAIMVDMEELEILVSFPEWWDFVGHENRPYVPHLKFFVADSEKWNREEFQIV